jgi:hypothetical protein
MRHGEVTVLPSKNPKYQVVAYAATVSGQTSSDLIVQGIGRRLGLIAQERGYQKFSTPVLGVGAGELPYPVAAAALARGFQETAPDSAELWITVRDPEKLKAVAARLLGMIPPEPNPRTVKRNSTTLVPTTTENSPSTLAGILAEELRQVRKKRLARTRAVAQTTRSKPAAAAANQREGVFISYSHKDAKWLERLGPHLPQFEDETLIWSDKDIHPGADWLGEIQRKLATVKVAVLLVSAQFLASRFIVRNELPPLLDAADKEGVIIIPVHISASRFDLKPELSRFQSANDPRTPLMRFRGHKLEEELDRIGRTVEAALKR